MKVAVYSTRRYDRLMLDRANAGHGHELVYVQDALTPATVALAEGCGAVCVFVNDNVDAAALEALKGLGIGLVTTRSTGFNHIDAVAAKRLGIAATRVTDYSPYSVAEFAVGLLLAVNRRIARASARTRDGNFELDGLMGVDLHGRTVGVVGTVKIGRIFAGIMRGFGCRVLGFDPFPGRAFEAIGEYVALPRLLADSDVISRLVVRQADALVANRYEIRPVSPSGEPGELLAVAEQKVLAMRKQVAFFADPERTEPIFGFAGRERLETYTIYDVTAADGTAIARFKKDFRRSITRSTWRLVVEGNGLEAVGTERA